MEIPTVIDNGASVSIIPMWYYQKHRLLHSLPKTRTNLPPIATGNGLIDTYFWTELPLYIQGVYIQLKCLVCDSKARHGLLLSRLALDQMQAIQLYDKREILLRDHSFPIYAAKRCVIEPGFQKQVEARVQIPDYHPTIQGSSVAWIKTNYTGYPLQPVVTDYIANITMVNFPNHTDDKHTIHKGQLLGYLDL